MIYYPPSNIATRNRDKKSIFLGGTIDEGNSINWQEDLELFFTYTINHTMDVFNPRRKDWDSSWIQEYKNPYFYQQVKWELNALEQADYILICFLSKSMSPISLLELGLFKDKKIFVICEEGYYRKGNIEIVCETYNIPLFHSIESFKEYFLYVK